MQNRYLLAPALPTLKISDTKIPNYKDHGHGHGHSFQKIYSLINLNNISCALEDREKLDLIFCDGVEEESCIIVSELLNRK